MPIIAGNLTQIGDDYTGNPNYSELAWDRGTLWACADTTTQLLSVDPSTGAITERGVLASNARVLIWDGVTLYLFTTTNMFSVDRETSAITEIVNLGLTDIRGGLFDGTDIYIFSRNEGLFRVTTAGVKTRVGTETFNYVGAMGWIAGTAYVTHIGNLRTIDLSTGVTTADVSFTESGDLKGIANTETEVYAFSADPDAIFTVPFTGTLEVFGALPIVEFTETDYYFGFALPTTTEIGTVEVIGGDGAYTYTLTGADASLFAIDADGAITRTGTLDYGYTYTFTVNVEDGLALTADADVTVTIFGDVSALTGGFREINNVLSARKTLASDGKDLYTLGYSTRESYQELHTVDLDTGETTLVTEVNFPDDVVINDFLPIGMAWNGTTFLVLVRTKLQGLTDFCRVFTLDKATGNMVSVSEEFIASFEADIAWDGTDLWGVQIDAFGLLSKFDASYNPIGVYTVPDLINNNANSNQIRGLASDGNGLFTIRTRLESIQGGGIQRSGRLRYYDRDDFSHQEFPVDSVTPNRGNLAWHKGKLYEGGIGPFFVSRTINDPFNISRTDYEFDLTTFNGIPSITDTEVGTVHATGATGTVTWTLTGTDAALFAIASAPMSTSSGDITRIGTLEWETSYEFTVNAADPGGDTATANVTVTVGEQPLGFARDRYSFGVDQDDRVIGFITAVGGTPPYLYTKATYVGGEVFEPISDPTVALVQVDILTGRITLIGRPRYTTSSGSFYFVVQDSNDDFARVRVDLGFTRNRAVEFTQATFDFTINNTEIGDAVGTVLTNTGFLAPLRFLLRGDNASLFAINERGEITVNASPLGTQAYRVVAQVTDANNRTDYAIVNITSSQPALPPTFATPTVQFTTADLAPGTIIGTVTASGGVGPIVYTNGSGANHRIAVDPDTGELTVRGVNALGAPAVYEFVLIATDSRGETGEISVIVRTVLNVAQVPPTFELPGIGVSFFPAAFTKGTLLGTVAADGTAPITYSLSGKDSDLFTIDANTALITIDVTLQPGNIYIFDVNALGYNDGTDTEYVSVFTYGSGTDAPIHVVNPDPTPEFTGGRTRQIFSMERFYQNFNIISRNVTIENVTGILQSVVEFVGGELVYNYSTSNFTPVYTIPGIGIGDIIVDPNNKRYTIISVVSIADDARQSFICENVER